MHRFLFLKRSFLLTICFVNIAFLAIGQDSATVLRYETYMEAVLRHHPLAQKAELKIKLAAAEMLGAKGNLDPILNSSWDQKNFDDKLYFRHYGGNISLPTKLGIDIVGGYNFAEGSFVDPENSITGRGLWNAGIEVNILQGLIVNERKIALDKAEVFQGLAEVEQKNMLNDLLYDATYAYLVWQQFYAANAILNENIAIADTYFENTKISYLNGEKTTLDTLEAYIALQDALITLQKNDTDLLKARFSLENFLWLDQKPIQLLEMTIPQPVQDYIFDPILLLDIPSIENNPAIVIVKNKIALAQLDQRLKQEKLKPKLKLKYNPLLATTNQSIVPIYSPNDYKWGMEFTMPLLFRSAKADVQRGKIKLQELEFDLQNKSNELQNKIENSYQQQQILTQQMTMLQSNLEGYKLLLDGENEKFRLGESSVFILNKRQEKYITSQLKLIELNIKRQTELLKFYYFSNQLGQ